MIWGFQPAGCAAEQYVGVWDRTGLGHSDNAGCSELRLAGLELLSPLGRSRERVVGLGACQPR